MGGLSLVKNQQQTIGLPKNNIVSLTIFMFNKELL
jgi:hypothetical protein